MLNIGSLFGKILVHALCVAVLFCGSVAPSLLRAADDVLPASPVVGGLSTETAFLPGAPQEGGLLLHVFHYDGIPRAHNESVFYHNTNEGDRSQSHEPIRYQDEYPTDYIRLGIYAAEVTPGYIEKYAPPVFPNVRGVIMEENEPIADFLTDDHGNAIVADLPAGAYTITLEQTEMDHFGNISVSFEYTEEGGAELFLLLGADVEVECCCETDTCCCPLWPLLGLIGLVGVIKPVPVSPYVPVR